MNTDEIANLLQCDGADALDLRKFLDIFERAVCSAVLNNALGIDRAYTRQLIELPQRGSIQIHTVITGGGKLRLR